MSALFDSARRVIYFGKATNLKADVRRTRSRTVTGVRPLVGSRELSFNQVTAYVSAFSIERGDASFRHDVEALVLRVVVNNTLNKNRGTFQR